MWGGEGGVGVRARVMEGQCMVIGEQWLQAFDGPQEECGWVLGGVIITQSKCITR